MGTVSRHRVPLFLTRETSFVISICSLLHNSPLLKTGTTKKNNVLFSSTEDLFWEKETTKFESNVYSFSFIKKISKDAQKCHSHVAQPSRGTKIMIDEEQITTKQTTNMKLRTNKERRTATEALHWNGQ